nr:hypothetical protein [Tanacetum cinerariifolium]
MDECDSMSTPVATTRLDADLQGTPTNQTNYHSMIGALMYLTAIRLNIVFATFVCACYEARPTIKHIKEVKQIFWYLRQSYYMVLWYLKDSGFELITYSDTDHTMCLDDCKSTLGGLQFLGEKLMRWNSKKQDCIALSTAEAEYVLSSAYFAQVIWMRTQLLDYGYKFKKYRCIVIQRAQSPSLTIRKEYQLANLFTKALLNERFEYLVHRIGTDNRPLMLEKDMYDSWKSRMELYMFNRQHGRMILESIEQGQHKVSQHTLFWMEQVRY